FVNCDTAPDPITRARIVQAHGDSKFRKLAITPEIGQKYRIRIERVGAVIDGVDGIVAKPYIVNRVAGAVHGEGADGLDIVAVQALAGRAVSKIDIGNPKAA